MNRPNKTLRNVCSNILILNIKNIENQDKMMLSKKFYLKLIVINKNKVIIIMSIMMVILCISNINLNFPIITIIMIRTIDK